MGEHRREAEGIRVKISAPQPRMVIITKKDAGLGWGFNNLSIKEAEGLLYALSSALDDAKREDHTND